MIWHEVGVGVPLGVIARLQPTHRTWFGKTPKKQAKLENCFPKRLVGDRHNGKTKPFQNGKGKNTKERPNTQVGGHQ